MPASDQGVNLNHYMLVPRTLVFITRGDEVLLLKGTKGKRLWAGLYNGIGGHVEQGEDIVLAARRELFEETGLVSNNLWLCGITTVDTQTNPGVCIFLFKGEFPGGEIISSAEGTLEWVKQSALAGLPLVADLQQLLPKVLSMRHGDPPFLAHTSYNRDGQMQVSIG
ncbi:MAG: hypothetical protein C3F13_15485 [Anaerolineales bacterium]|nr:NUDIX domain-containing protein [Anaerolineae bacterium]PWB50906.1 MAG: hypothetical protein C3F13_15485 [Anaerolineales bacterium]